jgi:uncharacterized membrane protein YuzA (DUF378 family)
MNYSEIAFLLVQILLIAGALNWGLVAYNGIDAVDTVVGVDNAKYVKFAVAAAALVQIYVLYAKAVTPTVAVYSSF